MYLSSIERLQQYGLRILSLTSNFQDVCVQGPESCPPIYQQPVGQYLSSLEAMSLELLMDYYLRY
jgi:hypothetical protein